MNNWFKRNGIHFIIGAILLAICFFYFTPAFQGKTLGQVDVIGAQSTQKEINDYPELNPVRFTSHSTLLFFMLIS